MNLRKTWSELKALVIAKELSLQYEDLGDNPSKYYLWAKEADVFYDAIIDKGTPDAIDFEDNFKSNSNLPINPSPVREYLMGVQGFYQNRGEKLVVPANSSNSVTITWPFNIRLASMIFKAINDGDKVYGVVSPDTTIGALTANVTAGDSVFNVSSTVVNYIKTGFILKLTDGTNTEEFIVKTVDVANETIEVSTVAVNSFSAATPTYVQMCIPLSYAPIELYKDQICSCGEKVLGGSLIEAGTQLKITYWNNSSSEITVYFRFEYWY